MLRPQPGPASAAWTLPLPELVPALRDVAAAFRRVRRAAQPGPGFRIGICDRAGQVVASATLPSAAQVQRFARAMADLGYADVTATARADLQGWHVLFVPQHTPSAHRPASPAAQAAR
jgi:hypothetical protein